LGLKVHGWIFRDDALIFGVDNIDQYWIAYSVLNLTGIITEFPSVTVPLV